MTKKRINTLILFLQWVLSILLLIYLIVPVYKPVDSTFSGNHYYSPYDDWQIRPLHTIQFKEDIIVGTKPDSIYQLLPSSYHDELLLIDSIEDNYSSPFLLGHSHNDIQYIIKKESKENAIIYASSFDKVKENAPFSGVHMQLIQNGNASSIDSKLNSGLFCSILAYPSSSQKAYNFLNSNSSTPRDCMNSLKEGRNLLVFSKEDLFNDSRQEIPVIRKINWKNDVLSLDLSKKGNIIIQAPTFRIDTLSNKLQLKIQNVAWFRFEVHFSDEGLSYLSNPYFKYKDHAFKQIPIKANNQLTIFYNLSWLFGIILMNVLINRSRRKYL